MLQFASTMCGQPLLSLSVQAFTYRNTFRTYEYLWLDDRAEFMSQFLVYNHVLKQEEIEAHAETGGVPECPPTLDQFKEQVM